ncbi:uncharacterized protein [Salvelinus alpinus]|uniref:uncharacterized protein isoform X5 n=1 Tax=Salvelinus alpinus TaxID=8036 RepID=UPI0039FD5205
METGENKEMETKTEDALEPSSECTCQGEEHQLFLQLEPEALDITDIESQHSDQQDDKTTKTDEEKTEITTSSNFAQSREMYDEEIRKRQLKTDWGDRSQSEEKTASVPDNLPEDGLANKEKNPFGVDCGSPSSHHPSSRQSLSCTRAQYHQCHH